VVEEDGGEREEPSDKIERTEVTFGASIRSRTDGAKAGR
jgi:hypothetical protein